MNSKQIWYRLLNAATTFLTILLILKILRGEDDPMVDLPLAIINVIIMIAKEKMRISLKIPNRFLDPVYESFKKKTY